MPGLVAGFLNAKLFRHGVVRFVWMAPAIVLAFAFGFYAPSNFREAFHYYFGGQFIIPKYSSDSGLQRNMFGNLGEVLRGTSQLRVTVPAYVASRIAWESCSHFTGIENRRSPLKFLLERTDKLAG